MHKIDIYIFPNFDIIEAILAICHSMTSWKRLPIFVEGGGVLRIIAGSARRTNLTAPKGTSTRPTADMAKEGLFNIIAGEIPGSRFLDLFCGSGAIGLEALSRRASEAVLVESAKAAIAAARQNITKTKLPAQLLEMPVANAIEKLAAQGRVFDIIFIDPPYETSLLAETLRQLAEINLLAPGGMIIAEIDSKIPAPAVPDAWASSLEFEPRRSSDFKRPVSVEFELVDTRTYGRTCFLFYRHIT